MPNKPKRNKPAELTKGGSSEKGRVLSPSQRNEKNASRRYMLDMRDGPPSAKSNQIQKAKGAVMRGKTAATSRRAAENVPPSGKGKTTVGTKSSKSMRKR